MDQASSDQHPALPATNPLSDTDLRYYYFGFHKALKRYRLMTVLGWLVVAVGCVSFPVGWSVGRPSGLIEIMLSCATVVAGLGLVSQSISSLESYVRITIPSAHNCEQHPVLIEIVDIMKDVDEGGWQEAYAAIDRMEALRTKYGLPALN